MQVNEKKYSNVQKIFAFLSVFMMFANVYVVPFIPTLGIGELLFMIFFPYFFLKSTTSNKISFSLIFFIIYSVSITFFNSIIFEDVLISDPVMRLIRDFVYITIIFIYGKEFVEYELIARYIKFFCTLLAVFIIVQTVVFYISGYYIPGLLLNVRVNDGGKLGYELYENSLSYAYIAGYLKVQGFLSEPAHCAQCLLVGTCISLFPQNKNVNPDFYKAILFSITALMTMSAATIIYIPVIWITAVFMSKTITSNNKIFMFILIVLGIMIIIQGGFLTPIVQRLGRASSLTTADGSTWYRIYRGVQIWLEDINIFQKIFGIGFGTFKGILKLENEYMNSISYLLISTGLIGFLLYSNLLFQIIRKSNQQNKIILLALIMMAISSSIYSSEIYVWVLLLLVANKKYSIRNLENEIGN